MKRIFSTLLLVTLLGITIFALKQTNAAPNPQPATAAVTSRQN
ncbi:MAG: hypothetical protein ACQR33_02150 [Candidatus Saccharibacteria bacterium]